MKPEPNWQPISNLPLIASMIDGQMETAQEQYDNLLAARSKPLLERITVPELQQDKYKDNSKFYTELKLSRLNLK